MGRNLIGGDRRDEAFNDPVIRPPRWGGHVLADDQVADDRQDRTHGAAPLSTFVHSHRRRCRLSGIGESCLLECPDWPGPRTDARRDMDPMETLSNRALTGQLADDLAWLEQHARKQPDAAGQASLIRLAAALARNVLGPALDGQEASPLHVVVVGGAGAGKSTVSNFLSGSTSSEAN